MNIEEIEEFGFTDKIPDNILNNTQDKTPDDISDNSQLKMHKDICDGIHNTYIQKNRAYGNSFSDTYEKLGIISAVTRITDKYNRLVNLSMNPDIDNGDESIKDTLLDMANYCIMTVMEIEERSKFK